MKYQIPAEIYNIKSRWKVYLAVGGLLIVLLTMIYVNYLTLRLKQGERYTAMVFANAHETLRKHQDDLTRDLTFESEIIFSIKNIPLIITDENHKPTDGKNFGEEEGDVLAVEFLQKKLDQMVKKGIEPISINSSGVVQYIYYENSRLYTMLTYFPLFQGILLLAFVGLGYLGFSEARKSEQNQVWVGMAKETAHQLGTPITAIMGWLEYMKEYAEESPQKAEVITELANDVDRLKLVADRFSKIGSAPELKEIDVLTELDKCRAYMEKRAPRKVTFEFPTPGTDLYLSKMNAHLFDWVIENLIRNALDAMEGIGKISANVFDDNEYIHIDITDTGKGIPPAKHKTVFQPGFTTKSRGWGLGLSLAKRIIEFYHSGKIFVKQSQPNEGTTFTIKLPKVE